MNPDPGHVEIGVHLAAASVLVVAMTLVHGLGLIDISRVLGQGGEYPSQEWRLLGSIESLIGFLLIGWSTAFIDSRVNKLRS